MANHTPSQSKRDIITLADLAPRHDVRGGHGRQIFGTGAVDPIAEAAGRAESRAAGSKKTKDLSPKSNPKGGRGGRLASNANVTLVHLLWRKHTMAGSKKTKDLSPKKNPKGGKIAGNANVTLVRAAKPVIKKDLSPKTSPKGGKSGFKVAN